METVKSSKCQFEQQPDNSVQTAANNINKVRREELDFVIEKLESQRFDEDLSEDQGIGLSGSTSPTDESSSSEDLNSGDDDLFEPLDIISHHLLDFIEELVDQLIMALDLRKKIDNKDNNKLEDGNKSEYSDDDNTALDLTQATRKSVLGPPPPLTPLFPPGPSDALKSLSAQEREMLRQSYYRLVRFLRLDSPNLRQFTEEYRTMALKRLQSFLFMYLIEVKRKSPAGLNMFQDSFGSDSAIRNFFRVFLGKSEQLTRTSSSSPGASSVLRPARFATMPDDGPPQILCRGPLGHERQTRNAGLSNAPYPLRRADSGHHPYASGSTSSHGHRGMHFSHQSAHPYSLHQQNYSHPPVQMSYSNPSAYQPLPPQQANAQQQSYRGHADNNFTRDPLPSLFEDQRVDVQDVIHLVCQLFPISDAVKGLGPMDFEELYGQPFSQPASPLSDKTGPPSSLGCQTPQYASSVGSPASPWQTRSFVEGSLGASPHYSSSSPNSPFVMSPPLSSANSSPGPSSPLPRSVEKQMVRMTLVPSQPPPLIPLDKSIPSTSSWQPKVIAPKQQPSSSVVIALKQQQQQQPVSPAVVASKQQQQPQQQQPASPAAIAVTKQPSAALSPPPAPPQAAPEKRFPSAHEEMATSLNPQIKEQSMRQVVKSTMEALSVADQDGDTPLMVACANPAYKIEDLYALLERLKSHPQPAKVFCAMNNRRETALYLAASERRPLVAGYLAETMSALRIPLNQTYEKGNTVIHYLAMWGDEFYEVLRYLVRVRTPDNKLAFDLNARNHTGRSALHETVMLYHPNDPIGEGFTKNIQLLLEHGADAGLSDITSGKTPVHIAVEKRDPFLLELLLSKCPGSANAPMYNDNRPLHSAATLSEVTDMQQLELVNILLKYGADKALRNKANKLPIELVQQDRDRVKAVLQARARQNYS
ncbi:uncharacterized protein LOC124188739 [Daphnia pulex]|uniref:uncharacterized protein LOC124188739 n=1 Tax=Daphnia pulex TaxID=6669 RepID=UPI001EDD7C17|nr:uncharacterized protein LOC124188739 [Daphnia pulex]XP_046437514.1 uncharacterized protein LOC124188739 [Daphnia pulex]